MIQVTFLTDILKPTSNRWREESYEIKFSFVLDIANDKHCVILYAMFRCTPKKTPPHPPPTKR